MSAPWHIVDDCLVPLADRLTAIVRDWDRVNTDSPPDPKDIERLYKKLHLDAAIHWLKVNVSVDYARDMETTLLDPLQKFNRLDFRALQILNGDLEGVSTEVTRPLFFSGAVETALEQRYTYLRKLPEERRDEARETDPVLQTLEEPYCGIRNSFQAAVGYLRDAAELLRGRVDPPDQDHDDEPDTPIAAEVRKWIEDLPPDDKPGLRETYRRDHVWLRWHSEGLGPAKIRDRWNTLSLAERKAISPRCCVTFTSNKDAGANRVKTALHKARREQPAGKSKTSRKTRSRKKV